MAEAALNLELCVRQVREALSAVNDPELDESVTELGFVQDVLVEKDGRVSVSFRLPTYWCSANFAYLMAVDMRDAIAQLPWAGKIDILLLDHFTAGEVSAGASSGKSFRDSFQAEAEDDLDGVRLLFRRKSFQKRQELLLRHLLQIGATAESLVAIPGAVLQGLALSTEGAGLRARYLQARTLLGFTSQSMGPVFHDVDGGTLDAASLSDYLANLRRVRLNTEFNSAICRGLLEVRYGIRQDDGLVRIDGMMTRENAASFEPRAQTVRKESFIQHRR